MSTNSPFIAVKNEWETFGTLVAEVVLKKMFKKQEATNSLLR
jgi:hypothetical protein